MKFIVLTIFPEIFEPFRGTGIIRRAVERGIISVDTVDIRNFANDRHRTTDDRPYGGGCGMVMKPEPLAEAIRSTKEKNPFGRVILLTPQGRIFSQPIAEALSHESELIFVCGRYEGIDERICSRFADDELSVGDFVLTGGEIPAMLIIDAVARLIPEVLGGSESAEKDSFSAGLLEHAHYTRPRIFEGEEVPEILLSGNHRDIETYRRETSLIRTFLKRPDLLKGRCLSRDELKILKKWQSDIEGVIHYQSDHCADPLSGSQ